MAHNSRVWSFGVVKQLIHESCTIYFPEGVICPRRWSGGAEYVFWAGSTSHIPSERVGCSPALGFRPPPSQTMLKDLLKKKHVCIHIYIYIFMYMYVLEKEGTKARIEIKGREEIP